MVGTWIGIDQDNKNKTSHDSGDVDWNRSCGADGINHDGIDWIGHDDETDGEGVYRIDHKDKDGTDHEWVQTLGIALSQ